MSKFIKLPLILSLFTLLTSGLVMFSEALTRDKIAEQKQQRVLDGLKQLIPTSMHDNNLLTSKQELFEPSLLGHRKTQLVYIGKVQGKLSVVALPVTSRSGYSGDIDLLVGIKANGEITAVKILEQHETPGLGDLISENKSNWLQQFPNKELTSENEKSWLVKRDGGQFDQITGATITPRAIVKSVKMALQYFNAHKSKFMQKYNTRITTEEKCT